VADLAALDAVLEVGAPEQGGGRADDRSQLDRGQHDLPQGGHVGEHHQHAVAPPDAQGAQMVGHPVGALGHVREAEPRLAPLVVDDPEGRAIVAAGLDVEEVEGPVEAVELRPAEAGEGRGVVVAVGD